MSLVVNHNLMAANTALNLNEHYSNLSRSTQRLSTGLRINSAADDAAGLAIRELQRADITAMRQGARNANDAISMIQVADGSLSIIDEKLIRMKELAEQAATGTYNSTQRLMIDSEFQQMASEIDRIASSTDFNGIHLLDGTLNGKHDGSGLDSTGAMKIHFGTGNDSAEDYYYIEIGDCSTQGLGLGTEKVINGSLSPTWDGATIEGDKIFLEIEIRTSESDSPNFSGIPGYDYYHIPAGLKNVRITSDSAAPVFAHKPHVCLFVTDGHQLTGVEAGDSTYWNEQTANDIITTGQFTNPPIFDASASYNNDHLISTNGGTTTISGMTVTLQTPQTNTQGEEIITIDKTSSDLVFLIGGHDKAHGNYNCNVYKLKIEAEIDYDYDPPLNVQGQSSILSIKTQEKAQQALVKINEAIVKKDQIRAHLGALQNRFENTITNLNIQAENLQNAESRISDVDVATEMTKYIRNQILTQSAVAMLSQANSLPQMAMDLLQ